MNKFILLTLLTLLLLTACGPSEKIGAEGENPEKKTWKLVWEDDFNADELDADKWTMIPPGNSDWNRHMSDTPACYALKEGNLFLSGIVNKDTLNDPRPFLTGGVYTKKKFSFQYGKVEIRAKLGCARGAWPAMWMLSENNIYGAYPRNGEIDIMEHLNYDDIIYQTVHSYYTLVLKKDKNPPHYGTTHFDRDSFNVFGLEWYPDSLVYTLNGKSTFVYPRVEGADITQWPFDQPFYLLIDQQLGGNWVGEVDPADLPVEMVIDWVRVWK
jgi:beta-glucanase (GH16 family)